MTYNPKLAIGAAILFAILSIIGGFMAREYKEESLVWQEAHELTKSELVTAKASLIVKDSQLKRALATRTKETPVLIGNTIAYEKTTESLENTESRIFEYAQQVETLTQANARLQDQVDRLSKVETSKGGVKRWQLIGAYHFPNWSAGPGFKQEFGLFEASVYGLVAIPDLNRYSAALSVGF